MQLSRINISDAAAANLREMIIEGRLRDGVRINEVRLAETLGISRTPLREALRRLSAEGTITVQPKRGYFVKPLALREFEQLYDIRPLLDPEALRLAGIPCRERLCALRKLNEKIKSARTPKTAVNLDNQWHLSLLEACPNKVLMEMIASIIERTRRYELALFRETKNIFKAHDKHETIMDCLEAGDLAAACDALKDNMQSGKGPIVDWLKDRQSN